ncbi:hypothetical protein HJC23_010941 [Cyclotella cryptica]|uniref:AB hydrolase-1 domain-containing protein n=1 Tax=Cyclotella cryptica TaxID=29204 RepID=A0ABD3Q8T4_9STRA|eukprot:CCRYP_007608-RA/>CCRYP_007608-RA protein AED:0.27 eAED:0.27 QI:187/1/1/1/1/1/5/2046/845
MTRLFYTSIFVLLQRAASFSVSSSNSGIGAARPTSSSSRVLTTTTHRGNARFASVATQDNEVLLDVDEQVSPSSTRTESEVRAVNGAIHDNSTGLAVQKNENAPSAPASIRRSAKSEMEQLAIDIRALYQDLELGGGSIRRNMKGLSFTYVAPAASESQTSHGSNNLIGAWRSQTPLTYGVDADWPLTHKQITEKRAKLSHSPNPPPLVVYLPGLDGFGISATNQFDDLSSTFELWRMTVDKGNLQLTFAELMTSVVKFIDDATKSCDTPREVIIIGESFGGLLACAVAMALKASAKYNLTLKGMALVNPATSFDETNWEQFVPLLTSLRYLETQEEIFDDRGNFRISDVARRLPTPYSVLGGISLAATVPSQKQLSSIMEFIFRSAINDTPQNALSVSSDGFRILAEYLPAATVEHRVLKWLPVGTSVVNSPQRLSNLDVPTLVIAGNDDNMLPTKDEANRLAKLLPDCVKMDILGSGHFVLDSVNLTDVLLDSHIDPLDLRQNSSYDPITGWTLPPRDIVDRVIQKRVEPQRKRASPVFFSTDSITGKRRRGLSLVPSNSNGPILFVGNHQLFGQDLGMIVSQLIEERNIVVRGLMHPIAADGFTATIPGESSVRTQKRKWEFNEDSPLDPDLFPMFGAVKVNPRNFYRLLQTGQAALLFPGGVREALHGKNEDYQVFWPDKTDFVRVAAKFNATIVPLAAIGAADSVDIILDAPELLQLPFGVGENLANFSKNATSARYDTADSDELFIPPLALPKPFSARHYFLFGRAFDTSNLDPKDKDSCQKMYRDIEKELKGDIDALLKARNNDPYAMYGVRRTAFQRLFGKEPPTFPLESLQPSRIE